LYFFSSWIKQQHVRTRELKVNIRSTSPFSLLFSPETLRREGYLEKRFLKMQLSFLSGLFPFLTVELPWV